MRSIRWFKSKPVEPVTADQIRRRLRARRGRQNVFVVGACNFPQNAGFNPTGTVGALAYRAAEGILKYHKAAPWYRLIHGGGGQVVAHADDEEAVRAHADVQATDLVFPVGEPPSGFYLINV